MKKEEIIVKVIEVTDKTYIAQTVGTVIVRLAALAVLGTIGLGTIGLCCVDIRDKMGTTEQSNKNDDSWKSYASWSTTNKQDETSSARTHYDWNSTTTLYGNDTK